jgi:hypothetical protein
MKSNKAKPIYIMINISNNLNLINYEGLCLDVSKPLELKSSLHPI